MRDTQETQVVDRQNPDSTRDESNAAEELSDELLEIELSTVDDTTVRGEITEVRPISSKIILKAEVPGGETVSERFTKPVPWSTQYKFARIVEERGYGPGTAHHLEGEEVLLTRTSNDSWEFDDPKDLQYYWEHYPVAVSSVGVLALFGVVSILAGVIQGPEALGLVLGVGAIPILFMGFVGGLEVHIKALGGSK